MTTEPKPAADPALSNDKAHHVKIQNIGAAVEDVLHLVWAAQYTIKGFDRDESGNFPGIVLALLAILNRAEDNILQIVRDCEKVN